MRVRQLLSISLLLLGTRGLAEAQPKRAARPPAAPVAEEKAKPVAVPEKASAPAPDVAGADAELGAPPTPAAEQSADAKLSPLTPTPEEFPKSPPQSSPVDLDRLLADIAALRSRVAALTTTLFKSKLRVVVEARGDDARIETLGITLDDGVVFAAPPRFSADDQRVVYEHAVAPGQHIVGIDIERYDARNRQYRTWQTSRFAIVVPESQLVEAHFVLSDDSDMAKDFPDDQDGEYELRVRLRARVTAP